MYHVISGRVQLVLSRIDLKRRGVIADSYYLLQVGRKKSIHRPGLFVVVNVTAFVRDKPVGQVTFADIDAVAKRNADRRGTEEPGLESYASKFRIIR